MPEESGRIAPLPSVRRLPAYLRLLQTLRAGGRDVVSCTHIGKDLGLVSTQVRKDLAVTGIVGKPKVGYNVPALISAIERFLGWTDARDAFLVGVGSLGRALMGYQGFQEYGLRIVAGFDVDPGKIGSEVHGKNVFPLEQLGARAVAMRVMVGVLTVPAVAAQDAAGAMVGAGIRAIWNHTPVTLEGPPTVIVEDVKLSASLAVLSSRLAELLRREISEPA
jgi:redox-sensing transcriptional repressor